MARGFPTSKTTKQTAEIGVNAVSLLVNDSWGWIFRRNSEEHDFGVDGYIDIVREDGAVTGQCFAVQIKTGASYFSTQNAGGITFYGKEKHLNYYLNLPMPILIVVCDPVTKECLWEEFSAEKTQGTQSGWKLTIPKNQLLLPSSKSELLKILGQADDHLDSLKEHWAYNEELSQFSFIHFAIERAMVEAGCFAQLLAYFVRLRSNELLCRKFQGKILLSFEGYENDSRSLWEIPEVRLWFRLADQEIEDWFYFLVPSTSNSLLKLYLLCTCMPVGVAQAGAGVEGKEVKFDNEEVRSFLVLNKGRLDHMAERLGLPANEVEEILDTAWASINHR